MTVTCLLVMLVTSSQSTNYLVNCSRTHNLHGLPLLTSNQSPDSKSIPYLGSKLYYAKSTWVCIWLLLFNCQPAKSFLTRPAILSYRLCWGLQDPPGFSNSLGLLGAVRTQHSWQREKAWRGRGEWSLEEARHTFRTLGRQVALIPRVKCSWDTLYQAPLMWTHLPGRYPKSPEESRCSVWTTLFTHRAQALRSHS